jgi:hypothetical protein
MLSIKVIDNLFILSEKKDKSFSPIEPNYKMSRYIPRQIGFGDKQWVENSKKVSNGIMAGIGTTALMTFLL